MTNLTQQQSLYLGIALIIIGVFALIGFWWIIPALVLAGAGVYVYNKNRQDGNVVKAVQGGLWLVGMALLLLLRSVFFFIPFPFLAGVLILAGGSLLVRGRESEADKRVQEFLGQMNKWTGVSFEEFFNRLSTWLRKTITPSTPATPTQAEQISVAEQNDSPNTGETTRL